MKKRRSKKTTFLMICIAVLVGIMVWALHLLSQEAGVDARFLRDLDRGLAASWAQKNDEFTLRQKQGNLSTEFIDLEYSAVSNYKDEKFKNKHLDKLAKTYISSLEACREAANAADPNEDFDKFWEAFSEPYGTRVSTLYDICKGDYDLELDDPGYQKKKDMLMVQGWMLHKADELSFSKNTNDDGTVVLQAKTKNDSGFDLKYVNVELELYDKKGKAKERITAFAENIEKGAEFELRAYQTGDSKAAGYRVVSETCEIKQ